MDWIKISIITTNKGIDPVSGCLSDLGIDGIEILDKDDFKEFLENNRKYWDYVDEELEKLKEADTKITVYVSDDDEGKEKLREIESGMAELKNADKDGVFGTLNILTANVKDEDWSENWKQYFKPIKVGDKVLIQPEWQPLEEETDRIVFKVNPGMTFGTGSHDSTRFCIEEIESNLKSGDTLIDLGCGSGILSIIALLLGASDCTAVDIDPNAVEVAYSNLELNGLDRANYHVSAGDIIASEEVRARFGKYDIVAANIVADVIIALSPYVRDLMKENAVFICSGIINERAEEVKQALQKSGLKIVNIKKSNEWTAMTSVKD